MSPVEQVACLPAGVACLLSACWEAVGIRSMRSPFGLNGEKLRPTYCGLTRQMEEANGLAAYDAASHA